MCIAGEGNISETNAIYDAYILQNSMTMVGISERVGKLGLLVVQNHSAIL